MQTPIDVIREALLQPVPCPTCARTQTCRCMPQRAARLDARAQIIHDALAAAGLLTSPQQAADLAEAEMEEVARFLARESRFIRYYDPNDPNDTGWKPLLASPADVELAYAKAKANNEGASKEVTDGLWRAQAVLLEWIEQRRAARNGA